MLPGFSAWGLETEDNIDPWEPLNRRIFTFNETADKYKNEEALSIRGIKKSGVINIKELYALFPGGPLKKSTLIAGIPKPENQGANKPIDCKPASIRKQSPAA